MEKVLLLDLCGVLALWFVVLACGLAELQYFPQHTNYNWSEARNHCQVCFKDLVTLTPENIATIVRNISSDHWIGLRKRPVSLPVHSYNDNSSFWSRWANGDPLTFQNWYPGYPVFKSPTMDCCSCQCTCPLQPLTTPQPTPNATVQINYSLPNTTYFSSYTSHKPFSPTTPGLPKPIQSECEKSPVVFQDVPDPNENYIEDGCVVMLEFGAWVEKECSMLLPFICYEEWFDGQVQVTEITSSSAKLNWTQAPGDIELYRVKVNNAMHETVLESLTLQNLIAGTKYLVQVFPVKCGRPLNPQSQTFYTAPNKVSNLTVVKVTANCVSLSWSPPSGNADIYLIRLKENTTTVNEPNGTICDLQPASLHSFTVQSGVRDQSKLSDNSTISAYTKPAKVSDLRTENVTDSSLSLSWCEPKGNATNYLVSWCYKNGTLDYQFNKTVTETNMKISDLPSGTLISLTVTALANETKGEPETKFTFTLPKKVEQLNLNSTKNSITATWIYPIGFANFRAELCQGKDLKSEKVIDTLTVTFEKLNSSTNYTVKVYSVGNRSESEAVSASIFTKPQPPLEPKCTYSNRTHLRFEWKPPQDTEKVTYGVTLTSVFWGYNQTHGVQEGTEYTFGSLKSGTHHTFKVWTVAGDLRSDPVTATNATASVLKEITLSMVCSSVLSLHCDAQATKEDAFKKMRTTFNYTLNGIVWELKGVGESKTKI